jgi:hypothetical protein
MNLSYGASSTEEVHLGTRKIWASLGSGFTYNRPSHSDAVVGLQEGTLSVGAHLQPGLEGVILEEQGLLDCQVFMRF